MLRDLVSIFYPETCAACGQTLYRHEQCICNTCYVKMPRTDFLQNPDNALAKTFYGRFPFVAASSYYYFRKKGSVQKVLHELKYKNNPDVGVITGNWFGAELKEHADFRNVDYIIPVPLHPARLMQRGYNQSEKIAIGINQQLNKQIELHSLKRRSASKTQTKKDRSDRWLNVENIFELTDKQKLEGKKILLVDDVITTGSTIEACANELIKADGVQLLIASIAYADE